MNPHLRLLGLTAVALCAASFDAAAQTERSWTAIGASGSVTPAQASLVEHSINWARIPVGVAAGTVTLRYNVSATDGLFPGGFGLSSFIFGARYIDNGGSARVLWRLRRYDHHSGALSTIASADSNDYPQSSSAQTNFECIALDFDFGSASYFVEVELSKSAAAGRAQIGSVRIVPGVCIIGPFAERPGAPIRP